MSKYVRSLNKSDSKFYCNDDIDKSKIDEKDLLKSAISDAKKIRAEALSSARETLRDIKSHEYVEIGTCGKIENEFVPTRGTSGVNGIVGEPGVSGNAGTIGYTGTSGYAPSTIISTSAYLPEEKVKYNPEDNTYKFRGKIYTEEFLHDFHSINPWTAAMLEEKEEIPEIDIDINDLPPSGLTRSKRQGGSHIKVRDTDENWYKTGSIAYPIENNNIINEEARDRLMKLAGINKNDKKSKTNDIVIDNIKEQITEAFKKRNSNWKFQGDK